MIVRSAAVLDCRTRQVFLEGTMNRLSVLVVAVLVAGTVLMLGCASASPEPTAVKPAAAPAKAAEPAKAPPAPTKAPAEPAKAPVEPTKAPVPQPTPVPAKKIDYPVKGKTVTFIVPFAAGGASDIGARLLAALLEKELGVSFQVANKPGATGQVGLTELLQAAPDGYTLAVPMQPAAVITYLDAERKAPYGRKSFEMVAGYNAQPATLAVKADGPYKTAKDLLDAAKANPGKLKTADSGLMAATHLAILELEKQAGVRFAKVHFEGAAPGVTAMLGGHVDVASTGVVNVLGHVTSGDVRLLAILDKEESEFAPGIKTLESQGYKVYAPMTLVVVAPGGTPAEIVDMLSKAIKKCMEDKDFLVKLRDTGSTPRYMDPKQLSAFWDETEGVVKPLLEMAREK